MDATLDLLIYKILLWVLPALMAILAFIGGLAVKSLMSMSKDINDIKISLAEVSVEHKEVLRRLEIVEREIFG